MKTKEIQKEGTSKPINSTKERKVPEISPEAKEERRLLTAFLLDKKEELIRQRNERKEKIESTAIELRSGKLISRKEIRTLVTALIQHYDSVFPNSNSFFKNMFRLHPKLNGLDYKKYQKPRLAGRLLKQLTYDRFEVEVFPALVVFAMLDGRWITKCYKHLTPDGINLLLQFRNQANEMMDKYNDGEWYEFYAEFCTKYKRQPRLF